MRLSFIKLPLLAMLFTGTAFAIDANIDQSGTPTTPVLANFPQTSNSAFTPQPPPLDAAAYVLMDANSGQIIAEKNMNEQRAPASLTKLMALYVIEKALANNQITLDTTYRISSSAYKTGGSKMFVAYNTDVPIKTLIQGAIVDSGNDAVVALAQGLTGDLSPGTPSFVQLMNQGAQELGMTNSVFATVNGLPDINGVPVTVAQQHSTAHDLALLARAIITQFPQYYSFYGDKELTYSGIKQDNRNTLLFSNPNVDGLKTGYTEQAGYCLIASAKQNNMRLIAVALGAKKERDRDNDDAALLTYGFNFYKTLAIPTATLEKVAVKMGAEKTVPAGLAKTLYVTVPKNIKQSDVTTQLVLNNNISAPLLAGATLGTANVVVNNTVVASAPLVALQEDPKGSLLRRLWNKV